MPKVSVVIPAYNAASYISGALASVMAQTYADYEVLVVNDGSPDTDALEQVLAPYEGRIVYLVQNNQGPSGARNTAIREAKGEIIAFLDSDDEWLPTYLEEQLKLIDGATPYDMVYADALLVGSGPNAGRTFMQCSPTRGAVTFESLLRYEASVITSCTMVRRQAVLEAGLFDERFIRCEDFDLWIRLAHRGARIGFQNKVLGRHQIRGESLAADQIAMIESQMEVLRKASAILPLTKSQQELIQQQLANCEAQIELENGKRYFAMKNYHQAALSLARANGFYRSLKLRIIVWTIRYAPRTLTFLESIRKRPANVSGSVPRVTSNEISK